MLKIRQLIFPNPNTSAEDVIKFSTELPGWSNNLIEGELCYNLAIHSLPGNKFLINDNDSYNGPIIVGGTGIFSMDFGVYPIYSLRLHENNNYDTYPTIIDIIYQTAGEETRLGTCDVCQKREEKAEKRVST